MVRLYRGYEWVRVGDELHVHAKYPNTAGARLICMFESNALPEIKWDRVHRQRRKVEAKKIWASVIEPYDAVWEIHEIPDELAYQAALAAYKTHA